MSYHPYEPASINLNLLPCTCRVINLNAKNNAVYREAARNESRIGQLFYRLFVLSRTLRLAVRRFF
jgi:hypothetical protein